MTVNGITSVAEAYSAYTGVRSDETQGKKTDTAAKATDTAKEEQAAVYEPSEQKETETATTKATTAQDRQAIISKMKADVEAQTARLQDIVNRMIADQAKANGRWANIYQALASGELTVDEATKAEAQADIADDGYFGVEQTSDRILDFAKALSGDDPTKAEELLNAFKKGYEMAEKTWGGQLPEICQKTYDAVCQKFDDWAASTQA